jgi:hypothetical protein
LAMEVAGHAMHNMCFVPYSISLSLYFYLITTKPSSAPPCTYTLSFFTFLTTCSMLEN